MLGKKWDLNFECNLLADWLEGAVLYSISFVLLYISWGWSRSIKRESPSLTTSTLECHFGFWTMFNWVWEHGLLNPPRFISWDLFPHRIASSTFWVCHEHRGYTMLYPWSKHLDGNLKPNCWWPWLWCFAASFRGSRRARGPWGDMSSRCVGWRQVFQS